MCQQLRDTSTSLEQTAASAKEIPAGDAASLDAATQAVKAKVSDLRGAVNNYHAMLDSVDI